MVMMMMMMKMLMMMMMMMTTVVTVMVIADADDDDDDDGDDDDNDADDDDGDDDDDDGQLREANFGQIWNLFLGILGRFPTPVSDEVPSSKTSVENCTTPCNPDPNRADQGGDRYPTVSHLPHGT